MAALYGLQTRNPASVCARSSSESRHVFDTLQRFKAYVSFVLVGVKFFAETSMIFLIHRSYCDCVTVAGSTRRSSCTRANRASKHARMHACRHEQTVPHEGGRGACVTTRWKQRHARTTLHLLCIYTTWLWAWSHGTQPWQEHKRRLQWATKRKSASNEWTNGTKRKRRNIALRVCVCHSGRGGGESQDTDTRPATFSFIVVYPVTVRFPRLREILDQLTWFVFSHAKIRDLYR